jgi:L-alanine-DL-glutamate epimerase-like enolase superfamily enzyme
MKITDLSVQRYDVKLAVPDLSVGRETLVVQVHTDEGVSGTGFMFVNVSRYGTTGDLSATLLRRQYREVLLGQNPLRTEDLWRRLYQSSWRTVRGRFGLHALSAVDIALWDLKGRFFNVPVCDLLGGRRERIPTYCTSGFHMSPEKLGEAVERIAQAGHRAVKIRASYPAVSLKEATARVRCVREAVGPDVKLMVDVNGTWNAQTAIEQLKAWEPYDVYWLEEPVPLEDIPGYVRVRRRAGHTLIAGGENHAGVFEFRQLIEQGAIDVAQPNVSVTGGLTDWLRVNSYAAAHGVPVSPWQLPEINLHTAAAFANVMWIEYVAPKSELHGEQLFKLPLFQEERTDEGVFLLAPELPGFGLALDEAAAERLLIRA